MLCCIPANTRHCIHDAVMLCHRLRRWPNITSSCIQCLVLSGIPVANSQQRTMVTKKLATIINYSVRPCNANAAVYYKDVHKINDDDVEVVWLTPIQCISIQNLKPCSLAGSGSVTVRYCLWFIWPLKGRGIVMIRNGRHAQHGQRLQNSVKHNYPPTLNDICLVKIYLVNMSSFKPIFLTNSHHQYCMIWLFRMSRMCCMYHLFE